MKKLLPVLMLCLLLSACNLPGSPIMSSDNIISQSVTQTLEAAGQKGDDPDLIETNTALPINDPIVQPSEEPAATGEITVPTVDVTVLVPTNTPVEPTPAPIKTEPAADDPAVLFGDPTMTQDFTEAGSWVFEDDYFISAVSDGQLHLTSRGTPWWTSFYTTRPEVENAYFEATLKMVNCSGSDRVGLAIRLDDGEFYYMGLTCSGTWGFSLFTKNYETIDILPYQSSEAINPAPEFNRIGILAVDHDFEFYVNGVKVGSVENDSLDDAGPFGFVTRSSGTVNMLTSVEKLQYWQR